MHVDDDSDHGNDNSNINRNGERMKNKVEHTKIIQTHARGAKDDPPPMLQIHTIYIYIIFP